MEDENEINCVVLDYIEGWYEGDAERMRRALSPHLAKRRIVSGNEIWDVSRDWMVEATGSGSGRIEYPENGRKEISILDRTESMASVRVFSEQYVDYLHLAKSDGTWIIVNALWDFIVKS